MSKLNKKRQIIYDKSDGKCWLEQVNRGIRKMSDQLDSVIEFKTNLNKENKTNV